MGNQGQMVRKYMAMRLKQWENEPNDARVKGELAQLRHGIGKSQEKFLKCGNFYLTDFRKN